MMAMAKRGAAGVARGSRRGESRRWCIDTALIRDPDEQLEGDRVLKEVADDLGILLWRIGRDVVLWAETPSSQRAGLFSPEAPNRRSSRLLNLDLSDDLASAVDTLAGQLAVPEKADAAILTWCCRLVAHWAAGDELHGTAVYFAQAGALCSPDDPTPALETGRLALAGDQPQRAESWARRTVALARRSRQWDVYAEACLVLGDLHHRAGRLDRARALYRRGYQTSRRHGLREIGAVAAHGVFRLARMAGDEAEADVYSRLAQQACAPEHAAAPSILFEVARFWLDSGRPADAIHAIRRVLRHLDGLPAGERLAGWALTARGLAADGEAIEKARRAWDRAYALIARAAPEKAVPAAIDLAHAATLLGDERRLATVQAIALGVAPAHDYIRVRTLLGGIGAETPKPDGA
jgi:tetratricopeptide (TPR) repeat protein